MEGAGLLPSGILSGIFSGYFSHNEARQMLLTFCLRYIFLGSLKKSDLFHPSKCIDDQIFSMYK